jgi:hypothetical protein
MLKRLEDCLRNYSRQEEHLEDCPIKIRSIGLITAIIALLVMPDMAPADIFAAASIQPEGLNHAGIYALRQLDPNLTGKGVKFAVVCRSITYIDGKPQNDYQPAISHDCFKNTQFSFHDLQHLSAGVSPHSTAICSLLFGRDPNAYNDQIGNFSYEGAVPDASAEVYEFWSFLVNNVFPASAPDVNVLTADIGYQFDDWWTRGIESMVERTGITAVVGIGNGLNAADPVLYPAAGDNVIGVGVVQSVNSADVAVGLSQFSLVYPEYSSKGPTTDGRCKPDIVAPGNCLAALAYDNNLYEPTGAWSSFATPIVAGATGLLIQKASQTPDFWPALSRDGGNCVIKSLLLNSATKLPYWHKGKLTKDDDHNVPLDWLQGAGMVNALEADRQLSAGRHLPGDCPPTGWDLGKLDADGTADNVYKIKIDDPAGKMLTATVTWNRHFWPAYPFNYQPQNDARIRLECWAVDANNPQNSYLLDYSDSAKDFVEHLYCAADPNFTDYAIIISYSDREVNLPAVSSTYGLAWNIAQKPATDDLFWLDLNADGVFDSHDIKVLLDNLFADLEKSDNYLFGDINEDGRIDAVDLQVFLSHLKTADESR